MSAAECIEANERLDAALAYADRGWPVFPCWWPTEAGCACGDSHGDDPTKWGKHPIGSAVPNGYQNATTDTVQIRAWWTRWPLANVAIATGEESGLLIVDVDPRSGGDASLAELEDRRGELPASPTVQTGGGGTHVYLARPDDGMRCRAHMVRGVDLKADDGYVIAPPSRHGSGGTYRWNPALRFESVPLAPPPAWLVELANEKPVRDRVQYEPQVVGSTDWIESAVAADAILRRRFDRDAAGLTDLSPSAVDQSLASLAAHRGIDGPEIEALVRESRARAGLPTKRSSYYAATIGRALSSAQDREAEDAAHLTDAGNAERLVHQHGADLHHVHVWNRWLVYDETRWKPDGNGEIVRRAKATVRSIYGEARQAEDGERKAIAAWAARSESASRIEAMISLARSEPGIPVEHEMLDRDPWAFNVLNGTVDLRTGELRDHDRADLATKLASVAYDPQAAAPTWERFLERIIPDAAVRAFLRRAVGYSLTGDTGEQVLFLVWGAGANGKSTFIESMKDVLGEYAMKTPAETLLARREGAIPNDVAALRGARFVAAVETEEGRRLSEVRVKELTGGDTVAARFMRAEWFTFKPVCKIWLATNHRPTVRGTDEAIWRRIRLVPFNVTIPEAERDRTLLERLRAEQAGILAWAVAGAVEWHRDGLRPPPAVLMATNAYRAEQDVIGAFLADRCVVAAGAWVSSEALYAAYKTWATAAGEHVMAQRALGLALRERTFEDTREGKKRTRGWRGIGLLDDRDGPDGGHKADATA